MDTDAPSYIPGISADGQLAPGLAASIVRNVLGLGSNQPHFMSVARIFDSGEVAYGEVELLNNRYTLKTFEGDPANLTVNQIEAFDLSLNGVPAIRGSLGATANRLVTTSGSLGHTLQASPVSIDGSGNVSDVGNLTASGTVNVTRLQGATGSPPAALSFSTALVTVGNQLGFSATVGGGTTVLMATNGTSGVLQCIGVGNTPMTRFALGPLSSATAPAFKPYSGGVEIRAANDSAALGLTCADFTASGATLNAPTAFSAVGTLNVAATGANRALQVQASDGSLAAFINVSGAARSGSSSTALQIDSGAMTANAINVRNSSATTTFAVTPAGNLTTSGAGSFGGSVTLASGSRVQSNGTWASSIRFVDGFNVGTGFLFAGYNAPDSPFLNMYMEPSGEWTTRLRNSATISWTDNNSVTAGTRDVIIRRHATGQLGVLANNGLAVRNSANNAFAPLQCSEITTSGFVEVAGSVLIGAGIIRAAYSTGVILGAGFGTSNDNFTNLYLRGTGQLGFGDRVAIQSPSAGLIEINNGTLGTLRDLSARAITLSSNFINQPRSVVSLTNNGQLEVEFTSNTQLTFRARGSDGVTRSASLTLS